MSLWSSFYEPITLSDVIAIQAQFWQGLSFKKPGKIPFQISSCHEHRVVATAGSFPNPLTAAGSAKPLGYANKLIFAPMVRISSLPFRMLAHEYGTDIFCGP